MLTLAGSVNTGAVLTSLTTTVNDLVLLKLGEPLSVTFTVTVLVLGPCASVGVQVMLPLAATLKPLGPETSANVNVFAGISESLAVAVTFKAVNSLIVWGAGTVIVGALFTSLTVI